MIPPGDAAIAGGGFGAGLQGSEHAFLTEGGPGLTTPAVAIETDDFLDEVPLPNGAAIESDGTDLGAEGDEIDAVFADHGGAVDGFLAVDHFDRLTGVAVEHVVKACGSAEVEVASSDGGGADVVDILRAALALEGPA